MEYLGLERRQERSSYLADALMFHLRRVAQKHRLDVLVLADGAGNLWAASEPSGCSSLAARAGSGLDPDGNGFVQLVPQPDPITLRRLPHRNAALFLVARASGNATRRSRRALIDATRGIRRILDTLSN